MPRPPIRSAFAKRAVHSPSAPFAAPIRSYSQPVERSITTSAASLSFDARA